jgi:RNA polymerase sigma factor (sigma-70 family)
LDTIRSRRREVLTSDFEAIEGRINAGASNPQRALEHRLILDTLAKLAPRTVEIVTLRYVHDYTEPDIAKLLRISRGSVAVTLFRARIRLRKLVCASSFGGQI